MDAFDRDSTFAGYRALQVAITDVWSALDRGRNASAAFNRTTWRTCNIAVPSRAGWDVGTAQTLGRHEFYMDPPA